MARTAAYMRRLAAAAIKNYSSMLNHMLRGVRQKNGELKREL